MASVLKFPDFPAARERVMRQQLRRRFPHPAVQAAQLQAEAERFQRDREEAWAAKMEQLEHLRFGREERRERRALLWFIVGVLIVIVV